MAQEHPLAHPSGSGLTERMNGQDLLSWNAPFADVGPWLYHAPLLISLLSQLGRANVLVICDANSDLPGLMRALPDALNGTTSVAVVLLDEPAPEPAPEDPSTTEPTPDAEQLAEQVSEQLAQLLQARLQDYPANIFNLILIDMPLSGSLADTIQGEVLARVSQQDAIIGLHDADRTPAGTQLATNVRLTRPYLANGDGQGLILFPTADDQRPFQALGSGLNLLRTLGRAYGDIAETRRKHQADADAHDAALTTLNERQSLLENTNKSQTGQLLEQAARLSDTSRAIAALPADAKPETLRAARAAIDKLRDKKTGGIEVPANLIRILDVIDTLRLRLDEEKARHEQTLADGQAIVAKQRVKEAELLKSNHANARMTQELAGLAVLVELLDAEAAQTREAAAEKARLEAENRRLTKDLSAATTRQHKLQKQIEELLHSTSWRVSAPVRAFGKVLRRRR